MERLIKFSQNENAFPSDSGRVLIYYDWNIARIWTCSVKRWDFRGTMIFICFRGENEYFFQVSCRYALISASASRWISFPSHDSPHSPDIDVCSCRSGTRRTDNASVIMTHVTHLLCKGEGAEWRMPRRPDILHLAFCCLSEKQMTCEPEAALTSAELIRFYAVLQMRNAELRFVSSFLFVRRN